MTLVKKEKTGRAKTILTTDKGRVDLKMRLTEVVRIGGRLALLAGFVVMTHAKGDSLPYFYGYSSPNLAAWNTTDTLGSQNVRFVPQYSLVSQSSDNMFSGGSYTPIASSYSFGSSSSSSSFSNVGSSGASLVGWTPVNVFGGGSAYSAVNSPTNAFSGGVSAVTMGSTSYTNVNGSGSWGAWNGSSALPTMTFTDLSGWQAVGNSATPTVSASLGPVYNPNAAPAVSVPNFNTFPQASLSNPEPGTVVLMAAGIAGLAFLRRRRVAK